MFFEQYDIEPNIAVRGSGSSGSSPPTTSSRPSAGGGEKALTRPRRATSTAASSSSATRYTIADIALYGYTHVAPEGGFDLGPYPAIGAWLARVAAQPGHIAISD